MLSRVCSSVRVHGSNNLLRAAALSTADRAISSLSRGCLENLLPGVVKNDPQKGIIPFQVCKITREYATVAHKKIVSFQEFQDNRMDIETFGLEFAMDTGIMNLTGQWFQDHYLRRSSCEYEDYLKTEFGIILPESPEEEILSCDEYKVSPRKYMQYEHAMRRVQSLSREKVFNIFLEHFESKPKNFRSSKDTFTYGIRSEPLNDPIPFDEYKSSKITSFEEFVMMLGSHSQVFSESELMGFYSEYSHTIYQRYVDIITNPPTERRVDLLSGRKFADWVADQVPSEVKYKRFQEGPRERTLMYDEYKATKMKSFEEFVRSLGENKEKYSEEGLLASYEVCCYSRYKNYYMQMNQHPINDRRGRAVAVF